ncbi:uncharacterized protein LOC132735793 [Ruditapes philippinarum]|uniref:uncharacterized protein LOC132735793 n=1 Tax=Ruditapes philippinarum TaxID=129788 RepID=UPI00295C3469|nr:uncharacterized protein LOC132735793 [Ruditapes philippinarum]
MTITDLTADTTYYFKVQARNSKGYGPMSPMKIYKTHKKDVTVTTPISTQQIPVDSESDVGTIPARFIIPPQTKFRRVYKGVSLSVGWSVSPSVCPHHGFRTITRVWNEVKVAGGSINHLYSLTLKM